MGDSAEPKQLKPELGTFGAMMMGLGLLAAGLAWHFAACRLRGAGSRR